MPLFGMAKSGAPIFARKSAGGVVIGTHQVSTLQRDLVHDTDPDASRRRS
jgi:hypothetical protein